MIFTVQPVNKISNYVKIYKDKINTKITLFTKNKNKVNYEFFIIIINLIDRENVTLASSAREECVQIIEFVGDE